MQVFLLLLYCNLISNFTYRGPPNGSRGKVVLLFDDNPLSKIGVRFDKPIPDGVDLGGACELGQGFFCNGNFYLSNTTFISLYILYSCIFEHILVIDFRVSFSISSH